MNKAFCTIIAKNYVAFARTLCESLARFHPDIPRYVLVVDEYTGHLDPGTEPFQIVGPEMLKISDLDRSRFKYDLVEWATAVKPSFLTYLIRECGFSQVVFFDPDILVTAPLGDIFRRLDHADVVLIPHLDRDFPDDGLQPDDASVLRVGVYNLGFIALNDSPNSLEILNWWKGKLQDRCVKNQKVGYFVDQRFMDLAVGLFENIVTERSVGYDAAYWNLHSRNICMHNGDWRCNGEPLYFFHFSSYRPETPDILSTYCTRFSFANKPELRPFFDEYRRRLLANGYESSHTWRYSWSRFKNGKSIPYGLRAYYRRTWPFWHRKGNPFESGRLALLANVFWALEVVMAFRSSALEVASRLWRRKYRSALTPRGAADPETRLVAGAAKP